MSMASTGNLQTRRSSLSYSFSEYPWKYEVFLSFRGEDTRDNFTDHLHVALVNEGIETFKDSEELEIGEPISPDLLSAIEKSRTAIVILSKNYASSTWCLQELAKIVECRKERGMIIVPIFYHVDPRDVRKQKGTFANAFAEHDKNFKEDREKVKTWRDALREVANLSGCHLKNGSESRYIENIVGKICGKLSGTVSRIDEDDLVGMDSRVEEMNSRLDVESNDVRFIGICGMSGMGKTTLARVVFKRIRCQFQASCFLNNVRIEHDKNGLAALEQQLLADMKLKSEKDECYLSTGIKDTIKRPRYKKVLIVLDDVDRIIQLQTLVASHNWFGPGSRIIITTKDRQLLKNHGVQNVCIVEGLNYCDALQLFCQKAFQKPHCENELMDLCKDFVNYANGHPLALRVLGSSLLGKGRDVWKSAWDRLQEIPEKEIRDTLQISFDALTATEKSIFLDIACFFNGEDKDRVVDILEGCGCYPVIDIENLVDKSLISDLGSKLWMHELLQRVGWDIVRGQPPQKPGERSRLWLCDDALKVLKDNTGTRSVEGIMLNSRPHQEEHLKPEAFLMMTNLRLLKICHVKLPLGLSYLPNDLRLLEWYEFPLTSMPRSFQPGNLVELIMPCSRFEQLSEGFRNLEKLKVIDLSDSRNLTTSPNFSGLPNLEKLIFQGCTRLGKIDESIGALGHLTLLNLKDCKSLNSLPTKINLESLEILVLSGCSRLKNFPETGKNMTCLSKLYLDGTGVEDLPLSIKHLTGLTLLNLGDCRNFLSFPSVICGLISLNTLILSGGKSQPPTSSHQLGLSLFSSSIDVTLNFSQIISFSVLYFLLLPYTYLRILVCAALILWAYFWFVTQRSQSKPINFLLPRSFSGLSSLVSLDLSDRNLLDGALPDDLSCLSSLQSLNLSKNSFTCLPDSISQLTKLKFLCLDKCARLQSLPNLSLSTQLVLARECTSLENYSNQVVVWSSGEAGFTLINCLSLADDEECKVSEVSWLDIQVRPLWQRYMEEKLHQSQGFQSVFPQTEIPMWFTHQNTGSSVGPILTPSDLYENSRWRGIVLCTMFVVHENGNNGSSGWNPYFHKFRCCLDMDGGPIDCPLVFDVPKDRFYTGSFGLWLYLSHERFKDHLDERSCITPSITTNSADVEIQACGARMLYQRDVEKLVQILSEKNFRKPDDLSSGHENF